MGGRLYRWLNALNALTLLDVSSGSRFDGEVPLPTTVSTDDLDRSLAVLSSSGNMFADGLPLPLSAADVYDALACW